MPNCDEMGLGVRHGLPLAPELLAQLDKLAGELSIKSLRERI